MFSSFMFRDVDKYRVAKDFGVSGVLAFMESIQDFCGYGLEGRHMWLFRARDSMSIALVILRSFYFFSFWYSVLFLHARVCRLIN